MKTTITFIFIILAMLWWVQLSIKRMDRDRAFWDRQEAICGKAGWFTTTGKAEDCEPTEYIQNIMEEK